LASSAHDRGCEVDLAAALTEQLDAGGVPDLASLRARFAPTATRLPTVAVTRPSIASYDRLLPAMAATATATAGAAP
jgi:hypothetical protein